MVEDGKIAAPVKGATLIGNGPDVLKKISGIGVDMALDPGIGTCGKNGQGVPVGVGLILFRRGGSGSDLPPEALYRNDHPGGFD